MKTLTETLIEDRTPDTKENVTSFGFYHDGVEQCYVAVQQYQNNNGKVEKVFMGKPPVYPTREEMLDALHNNSQTAEIKEKCQRCKELFDTLSGLLVLGTLIDPYLQKNMGNSDIGTHKFKLVGRVQGKNIYRVIRQQTQ